MKCYKDVLDSSAKKVADQSGVDFARTRRVFGRSLRTYEGKVISEEAEYDPEESKNILFFTELMLAGRYLGAEKTLDLFEDADLDDLIRKQIFAIHWSRSDPFLYTVEELAERYTALHRFLVRNRDHLLKTGYPEFIAADACSMKSSPKWWGLMHLYPTKTPIAASTSTDDLGNVHYHYTWCGDGSSAPDAYDAAPRFSWLPDEGALFLKVMRPKILRLGTAVAQIMKDAVLMPASMSLWKECQTAFLHEDAAADELLTGDEIGLLLDTDAVYASREPEMRHADPLDEPTIFDCFSQILLMIGLSDWIRTIEQPRAIRQALERGGLIDKTPMAVPRVSVQSYYQVIGTPARSAFDEAVALFQAAPKACEQFRDDHMKRVKDFLGRAVPVRIGAWMLAPRKHAMETQAILESVCDGQASSLQRFDRPAPISVVFGGEVVDTESARQDRSSSAMRAAFIRNPEGSWEIVFEGGAIHPPDSLGLRYLCELLRRPNKPVTASELSAAIQGEPVHEAGAMEDSDEETGHEGSQWQGGSRGDEIIDSTTIENVKRMIKELDKRIKTAEVSEMLEEAQTLDLEKAELESYLSRGLGLGKRRRRFPDQEERARKAVTAAIKNAITKIEESHPKLGEHLDLYVKTGGTCVYEPRTHVPWEFC